MRILSDQSVVCRVLSAAPSIGLAHLKPRQTWYRKQDHVLSAAFAHERQKKSDAMEKCISLVILKSSLIKQKHLTTQPSLFVKCPGKELQLKAYWLY